MTVISVMGYKNKIGDIYSNLFNKEEVIPLDEYFARNKINEFKINLEKELKIKVLTHKELEQIAVAIEKGEEMQGYNEETQKFLDGFGKIFDFNIMYNGKYIQLDDDGRDMMKDFFSTEEYKKYNISESLQLAVKRDNELMKKKKEEKENDARKYKEQELKNRDKYNEALKKIQSKSKNIFIIGSIIGGGIVLFVQNFGKPILMFLLGV